MRNWKSGRFACLVLVLAVCGCDPEPLEDWLRRTEPGVAKSSPDRASDFVPADAGTVSGRVVWDGEVPTVEPFRFFRFVQGQGFVWGRAANPNAPKIDAETGGLAGAVVLLRGPGLSAGRRWDHAPVVVELADDQIRVRQGDHAGNLGFVRAGEGIEVVSRGPAFHSVKGRGAAFLSLKLPEADRPMRRTLPRPGLVELSSAANDFWARAYLFVGEHPYFTLTDAEGRFELPRVPPGEYELVCWVPSWEVARQERDPETGTLARQWYAEPLESATRVRVERGATVNRELSLTPR